MYFCSWDVQKIYISVLYSSPYRDYSPRGIFIGLDNLENLRRLILSLLSFWMIKGSDGGFISDLMFWKCLFGWEESPHQSWKESAYTDEG